MTTPTWGQMSPADFDKKLAVRGHKRAPAGQGDLFYVATPTASPKAEPQPEELPGQGSLFGGEE